MEGRQYSRQTVEPIDESSETLFQDRRRCCFLFPCFSWKTIRTDEIDGGRSLWARGVTALKKIREWSEIVAGPKWKTFIRRFNRNRSGNSKHGNFQYDPLSYAMNFDEGPGQNSHFDEEADAYYSRNFSTRYANGSIDFGKDGPSFD